MKLREIMTNPVVRIHPEENAAVAARMLARYNIGALPVCGSDGRICGLITDRDLVTRCLAAGRSPASTTVRQVMTPKVVAGRPDMDASEAADIMGREQVRRLPVLENGRLCGMVSLGDIAVKGEGLFDAGDALADISNNLSNRDSCAPVKTNKKEGRNL